MPAERRPGPQPPAPGATDFATVMQGVLEGDAPEPTTAPDDAALIGRLVEETLRGFFRALADAPAELRPRQVRVEVLRIELGPQPNEDR